MDGQYNPYSPYLSAHQPQPNRGNDILQTLMNLYGSMPQGDGVRQINPIPSGEQLNNMLRRLMPQQDGAREFSVPQPNMNFMQQFARQTRPRSAVENRVY